MAQAGTDPLAETAVKQSKNGKANVRNTFPKVYRQLDRRTGTPYWVVDARSKKWGMWERKCFGTEKEAVNHARRIEQQILKFGAQSELPKEKLAMAEAYQSLADRLAPFGKKPEEAVAQYVKWLGEQALRQAKPTVGQLVDDFQKFKLLEELDEQYESEIKVHCRFIKRTWGDRRIDEVRRNEIQIALTKAQPNRNTRRKYLTFVRMFFNWVLGEDKGHITTNPADGIKFKPEGFEKEFYSPEQVKRLLQLVARRHRDLVSYYALLTFTGLRPSEGARVQWHHINFTTNNLHVIKGKTDARDIILEPAAVEWLKWHQENLPKEAPLVPQKNLFNLEREVREEFRGMNDGKWIADGLRHGFATFFTALKKDFPAVAWYMGNSVAMIKKHYAKSIPEAELKQFWALTPTVVLADEPTVSGDGAVLVPVPEPAQTHPRVGVAA